ncbi:MAG: hypothetical protein Q8L22_24180 [Reyranella sp.]|nr:hypothetical protein [Reyranella sp.]
MTDQPLMLSLVADIPRERLSKITRDFGRDLSRIGIQASPREVPSKPGERGDATMIGQIALGLITSGAVTALIDCLKAYLTRERSLVVKIGRPDGTTFEINARNMDDALTKQTLVGLSHR